MIGDLRPGSKAILIFLAFLLIMNFMTTVRADDDDDENGGYEDIGKDLGTAAFGLMGIGALYVILRRSYSIIISLDKEKYGGLQSQTRIIYRKLRKPLLLIHNWTLGISTVVASFHGVFLIGGLGEEGVLTGTIALVIMFLLSIFGSLAFFKFKLLWDDKRTKKLIRFVHRQWILSVILIIVLIIHVE